MSIASIDSTRSERIGKSRLVDVIAKKILRKRLAQLPKGRLVIEDNGEVLAFGAAANSDDLHAHILIRDPSAYRDMLFGGSIGAAEAYMRGAWTSPSLVDVVRLMAMNIRLLNRMDNARPWLKRMSARLNHWMNANTYNGSRKNIAAHYDLGNEFFRLFLDPAMMYSAAVFPHVNASLQEASLYKLDLICRKLELSPQDHLLEIGTGWGGLAIHAATHYGCRVTTTTISRQQYEYARAAVAAAGLEDRIALLLQDYRDLQGQYDKLVSVEMIEAVGHEYYDSYFQRCSNLLKPDGIMLIQSITIPDQRYQQARGRVDFIQRYIFPGGCLPSIEAIVGSVARQTDLQIIDLQDIGSDYARTLAEWRQRFHAQLDAVRAMGFDEVFCRMWEFYLCYCEGGFAERSISTVQLVFAKPDARHFLTAR